MNKERLSSTQIWVLDKLSKGETLHCITGIDARCFFGGNGIANVSWPTIHKLEILGLIKRTSNKVELTEFGKKYKP